MWRVTRFKRCSNMYAVFWSHWATRLHSWGVLLWRLGITLVQHEMLILCNSCLAENNVDISAPQLPKHHPLPSTSALYLTKIAGDDEGVANFISIPGHIPLSGPVLAIYNMAYQRQAGPRTRYHLYHEGVSHLFSPVCLFRRRTSEKSSSPHRPTDNRLTDNRLTDNRPTDNRLTDNRPTDPPTTDSPTTDPPTHRLTDNRLTDHRLTDHRLTDNRPLTPRPAFRRGVVRPN